MLQTIFHAPLQAIRSARRSVLRAFLPKPGECHRCECPLPDGETLCDDCAADGQM
jgi:hypothetical protein